MLQQLVPNREHFLDSFIKSLTIKAGQPPTRFTESNKVFDEAGWEKMVDAMMTKLRSRPTTLVHGDMRPENIFKHKSIPNKFAVIDWAALGRAPPGLEFH